MQGVICKFLSILTKDIYAAAVAVSHIVTQRACANLGNYEQAKERLTSALSIAQDLKNRREESKALTGLGRTYFTMGVPGQSIDVYERALAIEREVGNRRDEGNTLFSLSLALEKLGRKSDAIEQARLALQIFEQIKDPAAIQARRQLELWQT